MKIFIRKRCKGFVATIGDDRRQSRAGKTRDEAVINLIFAFKPKFGITKIVWDQSDKWTSNYLKGKRNLLPRPQFKIKTSELPRLASPADAKKLRIFDIVENLGCPVVFINTLSQLWHRGNFGPGASVNFSLGQICEHTENQIRCWASGHGPLHLGPKHMGWLKEILAHYGLDFKPELPPESSDED